MNLEDLGVVAVEWDGGYERRLEISGKLAT